MQFIIDGGPENNNHRMDDYINSSGINIQKLVALKDIPFSNSLIEAQNKLLKYRHLFKCQYQDIGALRNALNWIVPDYNDQRPHNSLKGLTPYEAYTGKTFDIEEHGDKMKQSRKNRLQKTRKGYARYADKQIFIFKGVRESLRLFVKKPEQHAHRVSCSYRRRTGCQC